jgi:hypothetical protein
MLKGMPWSMLTIGFGTKSSLLAAGWGNVSIAGIRVGVLLPDPDAESGSDDGPAAFGPDVEA